MTKEQDKSEGEDGSDETSRVEESTSAIEWVAAALGGALLVTMIGYMTYLGLRDVDGVPRIELAATATVRQGSAYQVRFLATNTGEAAAAGLVVKATLLEGEEEVESREITIDYLPTGSQRAGGFFFARDPSAYKLDIEATAYMDP